MSPAQIEELLAAMAAPATAAPRIPSPITEETLAALKAYSARFYTSQPTKALAIAELAHQWSQALSPPLAALGSWTLANALFFLERYAEADQLYTRVRERFLAADMPLEAARAGVGHVFVLAYLGQAERAIALGATLEAVLTPASHQERADAERLANLLMNLGVAYELLGQYEDALALYARQMTLATQLDDSLLLAQAKHNRAYAYSQINAFAEAERDYLAAEALFNAAGATVELVRLAMNHGSLLATQGRLAAAQERYRAAQALAHRQGDLAQQEHLLSVLLILVALRQEELPSTAALAQLQRAQAAFAAHGPALDEGLTWLVLGECHQRRAEWAAAQSAYGQAQQLGAQGADRALRYRALHGLAQVATAQGDLDQATVYYHAALQAIEQVRHELRVDTFRASFLTDKLVVYQAFTQLYLHQQQPLAALQIVERARARLLQEQLTFRLAAETARLAPTDDRELKPLATALTTTLQQLESHYQQQRAEQLLSTEHNGDQPPTAIQPHAVAIRQLEEEVQRLTRQIQRRRPHFAQLTNRPPLALSQLCAQLHDELLLYYHLIHGEIWLFCIDHNGIQTQRALTTTQAVAAAQAGFTTAVARTLALTTQFSPTRALRYLPALLADAHHHLATLYELLVAPIAPLISAAQPLLISPDGLLHYVPFHALYRDSHYLIETQAVSYIPSAALLELCRQSRSSQQGVLLCGYNPADLAAIEVELQLVATALPQAAIYRATAATTAALLAAAPHQRLLHIATHAHFRADRPMLSALALADRGLTLAEIARLTLDLDLAVLSGCETGHGELQGADLLSLAGGFLGAGARSLVVSLWRVADTSAATQMAHFYQGLCAGLGRNQALRQAQLALLQPDPTAPALAQLHRHPAFWAPFVLIGDWQPLPALLGMPPS